MKVTTEELERCEVLMTVEIEPKREQDLLKKAAKRIARQVRIPGFRPGKAPYNVIVRRFGLEAVQQEALEQSADKMIQNALEEAEVEPFSRIELDSIDWDPLTIIIKVPTEPKIELSDYRAIRLESEAIEVTDEDVEEQLGILQEQSATWNPVERPTELGDLVSMSVTEKDGDTVLAERESIEHELVAIEEEIIEEEIEEEDEDDPDEDVENEDGEDGENETATSSPPDLTTPLLGLSAGDEKSFDITYPKDFGDERYAGKDITFEVSISSVKTKELDPLNDEFAKSVSEFETLDELRDNIRENLLQQRQSQQDLELGNQVIDQLIEEATIEWPLAFEQENIDQEVKGFEQRLEAYSLTMENYLQMENKTNEEFLDEIRETVITRLKRGLVVSEVAEVEDLEVTESEILQHAKLLSDYSGRGDQLWREILASQAQQQMIAHDMIVAKTTRWLAAVAKGEEPEVEAETQDEQETDQDDTNGDIITPVDAVDADTTSAEAEASDSTEHSDQPDPDVEDDAEAESDATIEQLNTTTEVKS